MLGLGDLFSLLFLEQYDIYITWLGWFGLRRCAHLGADGRTGPTSILKIYHQPLCQKPSVEPWAGRGSVVRPVLSMPVYPWTGLTNAPRSRSRSKCETKEKKKIVTNISFCFWNVWLFNHTHGRSLGIWASTKRLLELENL